MSSQAESHAQLADTDLPTSIDRASIENEINQLVTDIKTVGDLIMVAGSSTEELLSDTLHNAGYFIERAASRIQELRHQAFAADERRA